MCSDAARGSAAAGPGSRFGEPSVWAWVGKDAVESGGGVVGSSYGSIAGTTVAGAVSSGRVSGLSRALCTAVAVVAEAIVVDAGR